MDCYKPKEITEAAKKEASAFPPPASTEGSLEAPRFARYPRQGSQLQSSRAKVKLRGKDALQVDGETIDLGQVEQLADAEQTAALGYCCLYAQRRLFDGRRSLRQTADMLLEKIADEGLQALCEGGYLPMDLALPRRQEILACLNRCRGLKL